MHIVKTWCETTDEGEKYLRFNGYRFAKRILNTDLYFCFRTGIDLDDVSVLL